MDSNCPAGYTCQGDHLCQAPAGRVLIESITVSTKTGCTDCSKEGVTLTLLGEKNGNFEHGVPCSTRTLDHASTIDYDGSNGSKARFDGTLNGATDDQEKGMMGGCYGVSRLPIYKHKKIPQGPLNAQVNGGTMTWQGAKGWSPLSVCVDWQSLNFAHKCTVTSTGVNTWNLVNCHDLTPKVKCSEEDGA